MTDVLKAVKAVDRRAYGVLAREDFTFDEFQALGLEIFDIRQAGPYIVAVWYVAMERMGLTASWMESAEWGPWWTEALNRARRKPARDDLKLTQPMRDWLLDAYHHDGYGKPGPVRTALMRRGLVHNMQAPESMRGFLNLEGCRVAEEIMSDSR